MITPTSNLKAWASALFTVIAAVAPMLSVGPLTPTAWTNVGLMLLGTLSVAVVPNMIGSVAKYAKSIIAGFTTVGTLLVSFFADGSYALSVPEMIQIGAALLATLGVYRITGPIWSGTVIQGVVTRSSTEPLDRP